MSDFNYDKAEADLYDSGCPYSEEIYDYGTDRGRDEFLRENGLDPSKYYNDRSSGGYSGNNNSGGCYLTSACIESRKLPDNCEELEILRLFRDNYLAQRQGGKADIEQYYEIAPKIVDAINRKSNSKDIWNEVYSDLVVPCVEMIRSKEYEKAYSLYQNYALKLRDIYLQ